jgi:hypothetical protein
MLRGKRFSVTRSQMPEMQVWAATEVAEMELGWKARFNVDDMCRDQWNWAKRFPGGYEDKPDVHRVGAEAPVGRENPDLEEEEAFSPRESNLPRPICTSIVPDIPSSFANHVDPETPSTPGSNVRSHRIKFGSL